MLRSVLRNVAVELLKAARCMPGVVGVAGMHVLLVRSYLLRCAAASACSSSISRSDVVVLPAVADS